MKGLKGKFMSIKLFKATLLVMAASVVCKATGLIREVSLASCLGVSEYTDAYLVSAGITSDVFYIIFASIGTMFIPMYLETVEREGKAYALCFMNKLINSMFIVSVTVCVTGMLLAKPLIRLTAVGFSSEMVNMAAAYTQIMFPSIIVLGMSNLISAYLQANDNFILPAVITAPTNIIITISIPLSIYLDSTILACGTLIGLVCQLFIQLPAAYSKGYRYALNIDIMDKTVARTLRAAIPMLIGTSVREINVVIDRSIATTLCLGGVAALNFAHKLDLLVFNFFSMSFSAIVYRRLSEYAAREKLKEFSVALTNSITALTMLILPIISFILLFTEDIVAIMYGRGSFGYDAVQLTSSALYFYAVGIWGLGISDILNKAFYSIKHTGIIMVNGIMSFIINAVMSVILAKSLGLGGIALSNSITLFISSVFLIFILDRQVKDFEGDAVLGNLAKILAAALTASLFTFGSRLIIMQHAHGMLGYIIQISVNIIIFMAIYIPVLKLVRVKEINLLQDNLRGLLNDVLKININ